MEDDDRLDRFGEALGEIRGRLTALEGQVSRLYNPSPDKPEDKWAGVKTAVTFMAVVIVPIVVAILGGYFALKGAGLK